MTSAEVWVNEVIHIPNVGPIEMAKRKNMGEGYK